jgi:CRISPR-associated exonuclease Cas4
MTMNACDIEGSPLLADEDVSAQEKWLLRVIDIKQYAYCPRVLFYMLCLPGVRPTTYKMEAGIAAQAIVSKLETRRSLRAYGVAEGVRHFHVPLRSARLNCVGEVDLVIECQAGPTTRLVPVDFKLSRQRPGEHFRLQLACYGMMLEEQWGHPAPEGILYLIPTKEIISVVLTSRLRARAIRLLEEMRACIDQQRMPPATPYRRRCVGCEFRRFCNDVL